ncbi:MAG: F0F1 ATP synthase subunit gamma [Alphaproteobacteria bacterium]|nr:F0F1 ATP synthase subunit gamma [Alphaproteobacteria bacterium]
MPSLKELKNRISSVKSTRKITSAMKMVAGSKLRRAQEGAEAARPYAERMDKMLSCLAANMVSSSEKPALLAGREKEDKILLIVITSDRGLCGGFNGSIIKETRKQIKKLESEGKTVKLFCIGRKGRDLLKSEHSEKIVHFKESSDHKGRLSYDDAAKVNELALNMFDSEEFDVCYIIYNKFKSVISQIVTMKQLIPFSIAEKENADTNAVAMPPEFEPDEATILEDLLPRALGVALYTSMLESAAGEQGARMTAMDNATRNAGDMIDKLTLNYNRSRQAYITNELIEIISGAEAV